MTQNTPKKNVYQTSLFQPDKEYTKMRKRDFYSDFYHSNHEKKLVELNVIPSLKYAKSPLGVGSGENPSNDLYGFHVSWDMDVRWDNKHIFFFTQEYLSPNNGDLLAKLVSTSFSEKVPLSIKGEGSAHHFNVHQISLDESINLTEWSWGLSPNVDKIKLLKDFQRDLLERVYQK